MEKEISNKYFNVTIDEKLVKVPIKPGVFDRVSHLTNFGQQYAVNSFGGPGQWIIKINCMNMKTAEQTKPNSDDMLNPSLHYFVACRYSFSLRMLIIAISHSFRKPSKTKSYQGESNHQSRRDGKFELLCDTEFTKRERNQFDSILECGYSKSFA